MWLLGHICDAIGTYLGQPHLEHEANPIYQVLVREGYRVGWGGVLFGKALFAAVTFLALTGLILRRRALYPAQANTFGEFLTAFFYGRRLTFIQTLYSVPSRLTPLVLFPLASLALTSPYFFYLGYQNLAVEFNWWRFATVKVGMIQIDGPMIWTVVLAPLLLLWLLWTDYAADALCERA